MESKLSENSKTLNPGDGPFSRFVESNHSGGADEAWKPKNRQKERVKKKVEERNETREGKHEREGKIKHAQTWNQKKKHAN